MPKKQSKANGGKPASASENTQALPQAIQIVNPQLSASVAGRTGLASATKGKVGAPKGNRNAAKVGDDLRLEMYLSKYRRAFFEQYFEFKFGRPARSDDELRETFRQIAYAALDHAIVEELERHKPGSVKGSSGETF